MTELITIGYMPKRQTPCPDWVGAPEVREVCSVSECVADAPDGWIDHWRHNEMWCFDSEAIAQSVISPDHEGTGFRVFAYRMLAKSFSAGRADDFALPIEGSGLPPLAVEAIPPGYVSLGYDVVSRSPGTSFECSPLSCNALAREHGANQYCLLATLEEAVSVARLFSKEEPEPGPYFVVEVLRAPGEGVE